MPTASRNDALSTIAEDTLDAFAIIADAAAGQMGQRPGGIDSFAAINQFTATKAVTKLGRIQDDLIAAYRQLRDEPAIARVTVADEDDRHQVLYIARGTGLTCAVPLCSRLSAKGRLGELPVGGGATVALPSGTRYYEIVERTVFKPFWRQDGWDARNTVIHTEAFGPLTIGSLRDVLAQAGWSEDDLDLLERQLAAESADSNVSDGQKRAVLTAMELRDQPLLDEFQGEIFRLPIDRQLAILGPAGTGKTTTLVLRLRQKIDGEWLTEEERDLIEQAAENGQPHAQSWLMFTPTDLLKHYVKEAFARVGVPAPDSRIRTWDEHRRDLARRSLPVLRSATGGTLVINDTADLLLPTTIARQIAWFEDFDEHQNALFTSQLVEQAEMLANGRDEEGQRLGRRVRALLRETSARPMAALAALAGAGVDLRQLAARLNDEVGERLRRSLAQHLRRDEAMLSDLGRFLLGLGIEDDDEDDEAEAEGDEEDEPLTPGSKRAAQAAFLRSVRAAAVANARGRSAPSRGGPAKCWLGYACATLLCPI